MRRVAFVALLSCHVLGCGRLGFASHESDAAARDGAFGVDAGDAADAGERADAGELSDAGPTPVPMRVAWVLTFGGPGLDRPAGVAADADGNVAIAGQHHGGLDFGRGALPYGGDDDGFVASFTPDGVLRWDDGLSSAGADEVFCADGGLDGSVYVGGRFEGMLRVGGELVVDAGGSDGFIAAYRSDGSVAWARAIGDAQIGDMVFDASTDASSNVYITGWMTGTVDFGGRVLTSNGGQDAYAASYAPDGRLRFAENFGGTSLDQGQSIGVSPDGRAVVAGLFHTETELLDGVVLARGGRDALLVGLDELGTPLWSHTFGGATGDDELRGVAVTGSGTVLGGGVFEGVVDFGSGPLDSGSSRGGVVAAFDRAGVPRWSFAVVSPAGNGAVARLTPGLAETVHLGARAATGGTVDGRPIPSAGGALDAVWVMVDDDGRVVHLLAWGGAGFESSVDVAAAPDGAVYVAGYFDGPVDFGDGPRSSAGSDDVFLLKLVP